MTDAILERKLDAPLTAEYFGKLVAQAGGCFELHRVDWQNSMLAKDGMRLICWFTAPDMESVRIALRSDESDVTDLWPCAVTSYDLWPGTVHDAEGADEDDIRSANVVVERRFEDPVAMEDIEAIEVAGAHCLELRNVRFLRTYFATDRKRMLCLYSAPDAESVRQAQHEAGMPFEDIWAFEPIRP